MDKYAFHKWLYGKYPICGRVYSFIISTLSLPKRIFLLPAFLYERQKKLRDFAIGDFVRLIEHDRSVSVSVSPQASEFFEPHELGESDSDGYRNLREEKFQKGTLGFFLFEERNVFEVTHVQSGTVAQAINWYLNGISVPHPLCLTIRPLEKPLYGEEMLEHCPGELFEKANRPESP